MGAAGVAAAGALALFGLPTIPGALSLSSALSAGKTAVTSMAPEGGLVQAVAGNAAAQRIAGDALSAGVKAAGVQGLYDITVGEGLSRRTEESRRQGFAGGGNR